MRIQPFDERYFLLHLCVHITFHRGTIFMEIGLAKVQTERFPTTPFDLPLAQSSSAIKYSINNYKCTYINATLKAPLKLQIN